MNSIEIVNLTKRFKNKTVLSKINLSVKEKELFGFLGRNGAGKSTLINILTGTVNKTEGDFKLLNYDSKEINKSKLQIGVMPDVSNLYENMTGFQFLSYMSSLKNVKTCNDDFYKLLSSVGLEISNSMKIKSYSFGMKKKISLAQALIGEPKLLFLDEPTSGVDPESIIHIQNLILDLNKKGITIFLTSHNLREIEKLCTSIAILKNGIITAYGKLDEIKNSYSKNINIIIKVQSYLDTFLSDDFIASKLIRVKNNNLYFQVSNEENIAYIVSGIVKKGGKIYSVLQNKITLEEIFLK